MIQTAPPPLRLCLRQACRLSLFAAVSLLGFGPSSAGFAAPLPYAQAVSNSEVAARAVLARAGRETCLRGKLTRALLHLSDSCQASGTRNPLCSLADKAVVVTPMSKAFMEDTSRQLLQLAAPNSSSALPAVGASAPEAAAEP